MIAEEESNVISKSKIENGKKDKKGNAKSGLKKAMKSMLTDQQLHLQPPKDSRPVSSMSSTGSATSGDSGCSFGDQSSPVNFTCGDTGITSDSSPLPEESAIADFLPLSPSTMQSFFAATGNLFDSSLMLQTSSSRTLKDTKRHTSTNKLESMSKKSESPILQMHHYRQQARQQGVLANSNSSPCLFGIASAAAAAAAAAANTVNQHIQQQQQQQQQSGGDDHQTSPLPLPLPFPANFATATQQNNNSMANRTMSAATSFSDLTQYINPEIHNVRVPTTPQDQGTNGASAKGNRQEAYKTVMCQAWLESTKCSFGDNCKFAHGESELRPTRQGSLVQARNNAKYKTKLCDKYTTTGICPYGSRCLFIHPAPRAPGSPIGGNGGGVADNGFGNASALLTSAMLLSNLNRFEGLPKVQQNQPNQLELLRKLLAATQQQQQQFNPGAAFMASNFPPLPSAYSMPSVFATGGSGFKLGQNSHRGQPPNNDVTQVERKPSVWSQATFGAGNDQEAAEGSSDQDGFRTPNGSRPHPSWPLEPPNFFNELRRSSCIEHTLTNSAICENIEAEKLASRDFEYTSNKPETSTKIPHQARGFGSRFHHQSMPLFNLSSTFQNQSLHQHPTSPKNSAQNSGGDLSAAGITIDFDGGEYPPLSDTPAPMERSSTHMTIPSVGGSISPISFRPLRKRFSNGVLHSVTPHSQYSSNSSCTSCSTSSSMYLNGAVGRDILAEIWSSSVDSSPEEEEEFAHLEENPLEIPPSLGGQFTPFYEHTRHMLDRDDTLTRDDLQPPSTIDELSRQLELQKLEEFLIATSDPCPPHKGLESEKSQLAEFFHQEEGIGGMMKRSSPDNLGFQEFTDFDEIPALN